MTNRTIYTWVLMALLTAGPANAQQADDERGGGLSPESPLAEEVEAPVPGMDPVVVVSKANADSAYIREDYASAVELYEALLASGEAAEVYYNLGNSYYKLDDIARAILNYERALLLQPGNADIRANLEIARAKTVDRETPIPEVFFVTWGRSLVNILGVDAWARLAIACFILCLGCFALFFVSGRVRIKKMGFTGGIVLLIVVLIAHLAGVQQKRGLTRRNDAIVVTPSVTVRSTPSESGTSLFILHEGRKVEIKDNSMREWKEIKLEDGKVGWIPTSCIEVI